MILLLGHLTSDKETAHVINIKLDSKQEYAKKGKKVGYLIVATKGK